MMENWDTDTPIYRDIRLLSGVRRLNPAVSLGSQWNKYLTADVYAYVRRYRDSVCFVAMNRGEATTIDVHTDLPDGEHSCIVTRRKLEVQGGMLHQLELGAKEAVVISHVGERIKGKVLVRAHLNGLSTDVGQVVVVTGDCPELGNWDITKAYTLEYINSNTWFAEIPFEESVGKAIAYKYAIVYKDEQGNDAALPTRENIVCRRWLLADEGTVKWVDKWAN
jgi:cyclomaltodextrin glucanotransferase